MNPRLVRGLDYYSRTTFEWITDELGAQGAVCAGGRYDGLVELIGGRPVAGGGLGAGDGPCRRAHAAGASTAPVAARTSIS